MDKAKALLLRLIMNMNPLNFSCLEFRKFLGAVGMNFDIKKCIFAFVAMLLTYFFLGDVYLYLMVQGTDGKMPMDFNNGSVPCHPQPYCHLDMKSFLLDMPNFYIHHPLSAVVYDWTQFGTNFSFISANFISIFHVFLAMISAKCISNDSLCVRRVGVAIFAMRNFLDAFDGTVARARRKNLIGYNNFGSSGYWVDGLADALGTTFLFFGCLFYILRHPSRGKFAYSPLPVVINKGNEDHWENGSTKVHNGCGFTSGLQPVVLGIQSMINSMCWNRYIALYTKLLEENHVSEEVRLYQGRVVKSSMMWVVIMCWRIFNVHAMLEMLLAAVFFDKMVEFMTFMQFMGLIPLALSAILSELHINDIQIYLSSQCSGVSCSTSGHSY